MQPFVSEHHLRVIKLGGSLLTLPDLRNRFHRWLNDQSPAINLLVCGGGELVEAIRQIDSAQQLETTFTHWLCIDLMKTTASLAAAILGIEHVIAEPNELSRFVSASPLNTLAVIQPTAYLSREANAAQPAELPALPENWDCTSDAISAWLALKLDANELVLLKSTGVDNAHLQTPSLSQLNDWARQGLVDTVFPSFAHRIAKVSVVNLRASQFNEHSSACTEA